MNEYLYLWGGAMIRSNLRIMAAIKKKNINDLVKETGLAQPTISKLFNDTEDVAKTKLYVIDLLCKALDCGINDILEYIEDK